MHTCVIIQQRKLAGRPVVSRLRIGPASPAPSRCHRRRPTFPQAAIITPRPAALQDHAPLPVAGPWPWDKCLHNPAARRGLLQLRPGHVSQRNFHTRDVSVRGRGGDDPQVGEEVLLRRNAQSWPRQAGTACKGHQQVIGASRVRRREAKAPALAHGPRGAQQRRVWHLQQSLGRRTHVPLPLSVLDEPSDEPPREGVLGVRRPGRVVLRRDVELPGLRALLGVA